MALMHLSRVANIRLLLGLYSRTSMATWWSRTARVLGWTRSTGTAANRSRWSGSLLGWCR